MNRNAISPKTKTRLAGMNLDSKPHANGDWSCPECGKPYGKRRRCFNRQCSRSGYHAGRPAKVTTKPDEVPTTPAVPVPHRTTPILREIHAMRAMVEALKWLEPDGVRRVLAWINAHHEDKR